MQEEFGDKAATVEGDVTKEKDSDRLAETAMAAFGKTNLVAHGYVATPMLEKMNKNALSNILENAPIGRLIDPYEVASQVSELYRNEALAGDVFFIHGGLRLGSKG